MSISIIIPSFNSSATIASCLESLYNQTRSDLIKEIIVVDDHSTDNTAGIITNQFKDVILLKTDKQSGPAIVRNRGIERARGDILAFLDSDCIACEEWISVIVDTLKKYDVVTGMVSHEQSFLGNMFAIANFGEFQYVGDRDITNLCGNNFAIKRELTKEYTFPVRMRVSEDRTLAWCLSRGGYMIRYRSSLQVFHNPPVTVKKLITSNFGYGKYSVLSRMMFRDLPGAPWLKIPILVPFIFSGARLTKDMGYLFKNKKHLHIIPISLPFFIVCLVLVRITYFLGCCRGIWVWRKEDIA